MDKICNICINIRYTKSYIQARVSIYVQAHNTCNILYEIIYMTHRYKCIIYDNTITYKTFFLFYVHIQIQNIDEGTIIFLELLEQRTNNTYA